MKIDVWFFDDQRYIDDANRAIKNKGYMFPWDWSWDHYFHLKQIDTNIHREFEIIPEFSPLNKKYKFIEIDNDYLWIDSSIDSIRRYSWVDIMKWEKTREMFLKDGETYFNDIRKIINRDIKIKELLNER